MSASGDPAAFATALGRQIQAAFVGTAPTDGGGGTSSSTGDPVQDLYRISGGTTVIGEATALDASGLPPIDIYQENQLAQNTAAEVSAPCSEYAEPGGKPGRFQWLNLRGDCHSEKLP